MRIGIHTGTVLSGLVGDTRPQFSLFGDTVNMASRIQSSGKKDRIHLSEETFEYIRGEYAVEPRRTFIKGKVCSQSDTVPERCALR